MCGELDHFAGQQVQRARPFGGLEQTVVSSRAFSLSGGLRSVPRRGSSLNAASRLSTPGRNRCHREVLSLVSWEILLLIS